MNYPKLSAVSAWWLLAPPAHMCAWQPAAPYCRWCRQPPCTGQYQANCLPQAQSTSCLHWLENQIFPCNGFVHHWFLRSKFSTIHENTETCAMTQWNKHKNSPEPNSIQVEATWTDFAVIIQITLRDLARPWAVEGGDDAAATWAWGL